MDVRKYMRILKVIFQRIKQEDRILPIAVVLSGLFWVIDALLDSIVFREGDVFQQLFVPDHHEKVIRLLVMLVFLVFAFYTLTILKQRKGLTRELQAALMRAEDEKAKNVAIISAMGDGISIQDTELRIQYQNQAHQALMGPHVGEFCYKAYQHKDAPCDGCHVIQSFSDGMIHRRESSFMGETGLKHVEIISSPLRDQAGNIVAGIEMVRDITQRKEVEAAYERQANLLQKLIDTIPNPIFYKDKQGVFLGCNAAFEHCIGIAKQGVVGKTVFELISEEVALLHDEKDMELLAHPGIQIYESFIPCADNARRDVIFNKATYVDNNGELAGLVGVIIDITERKQAEDEIRKLNVYLSQHAAELSAANKELEAFSYSVSHDLRTPLTRIYSSSQALQEGYGNCFDANGNFFVHTIIEACEQMEELIEALLNLSRVSSREMCREDVNLSVLVEEIFAGLRQAEPERNVTLTVAPDVMVTGDAPLLMVALENLLSNAWKYSKKLAEAIIEFGVFEDEGERVFFVRDNGAGFDMDMAANLFKPFQRLHKPNDFPGTGVGLATVKRIVQRHGGRVWGEGEVGNGATFYFTLGNKHAVDC